MPNIVFWLNEMDRKAFIQENELYHTILKEKLLGKFDDNETNAINFANGVYPNWHSGKNPELSKMQSDFAFAQYATYFGILDYLHFQTNLSILSGLFFQLEKNIRNWLVNDIAITYPINHAKHAILNSDMSKIFKFLACFENALLSMPFYGVLDECRLIVNVYKHGHGKAFDQLSALRPDLIAPVNAFARPGIKDTYSHFNLLLKVEEVEIDKLFHAINEFWKSLPNCYTSSHMATAPKWVLDSFAEDGHTFHEQLTSS